jgi:hypothetical protein
MRRLLIGIAVSGWVFGSNLGTPNGPILRAETASRPPPSGSVPPAPLPPPSSSAAPTPNACGAGKTRHAMAIPQGKSGVIELVLTDQAASCAYGSAPRSSRCDYVRARISLSPAMQKRGTYALGAEFAYLDHEYSSSGGAWQRQPVCSMGGGDLTGSLEILAITATEIRGRICGSRTGSPNENGLVDGTFVASRCPSCAMTGDSCSSNSDCCAANCGGGTCHP